jgi:choline dehydrogenase-like flavoprotein
MVEAVKEAIRIGRSPAFSRFSPVLNPNHFPGCESFNLWSDDYIKCYIKHYTMKGDNYVGTCRMGNASDENAVVDDQLNVLGGVSGLRVVDASIIPEIPSGDIYATVVAIAERAADLIKDRYSH